MNDIAQARIKKSRMGRVEAEAAAKEKVPFRNGDILAFLYAFLYALVLLGLKQWLHLDERFGAVFLGGTQRHVFDFAIMAAALLVARHSLKDNSPGVIKRNSRLLMLSLVGVFDIILSVMTLFVLSRGFFEVNFGITPALVAAWSPFLLPVLFAPALATLLTDIGSGRTVAFSVALTHTMFVPTDAALPVVLMCLLPAFGKLKFIPRARRRSQLLTAFANGWVASFAGALTLVIYRAYGGMAPESAMSARMFIGEIGACATLTLVSAAISFTAVVIALPLFEHIFAACSNIKLNNYSDLEHPLLRTLSNDAPGTYQHSAKVADLAFEAAGKIGANPLLCRVGAYFHDIGKIDNPRYYAENLGYNEQNPHDKLPPSMSASILEAHIKQGLAHADGNIFPAEIRRIIKEHHGTTVKDYFLFKAREQAKLRALETGTEPERVNESAFRYNTDKPTSKEAGIVMLADSVEAATRSLNNVTPQTISSLVDDITKKKINDGQFDECPLSFTEINTIKKSFVVTLQHILHQRIAYPKATASDSDNRKPTAKPAN